MQIRTAFDSGTLRIFFDGELDHHAAQSAVTRIERDIDSFLPRVCVLDMDALTFMDSSGIAVILKTLRHMSELAGETRVENVRKQPMRVLVAASLGERVRIAEKQS
jgi:stage II sporulation protein AA (anti-sigma F factor antagonist)